MSSLARVGEELDPLTHPTTSHATSHSDTYTREQHQAALTKARQEERQRNEAVAAKLRKELEEARASQRQNDLSAMEPIQRLQAQLETALNRINELSQSANQTSEQLTQYKLGVHKEREIRSYNGRIIPELVSGSTEEEITASAKASHERFVKIEAETEARVRQAIEAQLPPPPPAAPTVVVPVNPAYTQPVSLPPGSNPQGSPTSSAPSAFSFNGSVEQQVRSGNWAQNRGQVLRELQGQPSQYQGSIGNQPLHHTHQQQPVAPHTVLPGGVVQPTGIPSVQPQNPAHQAPANMSHTASPQPQQTAPVQYPQPVMAPPEPQGGNDIRSMAQESLGRLHTAGPVDPHVLGTPASEVRDLFNDAQRYGASRGVTPASAFAERFAS